jgi:hypothetical protein
VKAFLIAMTAMSLLCGCSAEQAYNSGQAWQRNECNKLPDKADYDRCVGRANGTYDSYRRQTEPAQNK